MIMRKLRDLLNNVINFIENYKKPVIIILSIVVVIILYFLSSKNYYYGVLFYPDKTKASLIYEKHAIIYGKNSLDEANKIIDELLLGPVNQKFLNIFSSKAKLLSSRIEKDTLIVNLTKDTLMDINTEKNKNVSLHYLALQSIVTSVCFHEKSIKKVKFYFDGIDYKFIGDYGPITEGMKPDWKILKK
jgi:hypothetical protein